MKQEPMRGWSHLHLSTCECGKRSYRSKSAAKAARKNFDRSLRPYQCKSSGWWHLGHVPDDLRHGEVDREHLFGGR